RAGHFPDSMISSSLFYFLSLPKNSRSNNRRTVLGTTDGHVSASRHWHAPGVETPQSPLGTSTRHAKFRARLPRASGSVNALSWRTGALRAAMMLSKTLLEARLGGELSCALGGGRRGGTRGWERGKPRGSRRGRARFLLRFATFDHHFH